jgi:hypothetical protein
MKIASTNQTNTYEWALMITMITDVDRDSSVGIATRYGMDSPRIESR